MSRRIDINGKSFRIRRGKMVEIPEKWVGKITTKKTIRQRNSKLTKKLRRESKRKLMSLDLLKNKINNSISRELSSRQIDVRGYSPGFTEYLLGVMSYHIYSWFNKSNSFDVFVAHGEHTFILKKDACDRPRLLEKATALSKIKSVKSMDLKGKINDRYQLYIECD